jgi:hypothetical protein
VVIDHDHVQSGIGRRRQRIERGHTAIHRHHQFRSLPVQAQQRRRVGAIALDDTVGDIDRQIGASGPEEAPQQGGGRRAVHIVIAEHRHLLAGHDRPRDAVCRDIHVPEMAGVGHQRAQSRRQISGRPVHSDAARRQHPADQFGQAIALRQRQRRALVTGTRQPAPAGKGLIDVQKGRRGLIHHQDTQQPETRSEGSMPRLPVSMGLAGIRR